MSANAAQNTTALEAIGLSPTGPRLVDGVADRMPVRVKRSARVVYLSDAGVTMDADFADVTVGTDVTAAVQAILDTAPTVGRLRVVVDGVLKAGDLKVRSNTTIEGLGWGTGIVQAADSRSAIRNYNYRSPYTAGSHNGRIIDRNIIVRNLQIHGNRLNAAANALRTGNWPTNYNYLKAKSDGELVHPVKFFGVENLTVEDLYVRDPACFHINVAFVRNARFRRIRFNDSAHANALRVAGTPTGGTYTLTVTSPGGLTANTATIAYNASAATVQAAIEAVALVGTGNVTVGAAMGSRLSVVFAAALDGTYLSLATHALTGGTSPTVEVGPFNGPNTAGIQVQGPAYRVRISELWGDTSDDVVAFNAQDWNLVPGGTADNLQGAASWGGGYDVVYQGDVLDVEVKDCRVNTSSGFRFLSATSRIDNVRLRRIGGRATINFVETSNNIPGVSGAGNIGTILVDGVTLAALDPRSDSIGFVNLASKADRVTIRNVVRDGCLRGVYDSIYVNTGSDIGTLEVEGYQLYETGTDSATASLRTRNGSHLVIIQGGTVKLARVRRVQWVRRVDLAGALGVYPLAALAVVSYTGGTVGSIQVTSCQVDNVAWLVAVTAGTLAELHAHGNKHTTAAGNASVAVSGATLSRFRAGGNDTRLLSATGSGGVITDARTDTVEDDAVADTGSATLGTLYTATTSMAAVGVSVSLPRAGTYLVYVIVRAGQDAGAYLTLRLYDQTNAAQVGGVVLSQYVPGISTQVSVMVAGTVRVTAAATVRLEAKRTGTGGTVEIGSGDGQTVLYYARIGN